MAKPNGVLYSRDSHRKSCAQFRRAIKKRIDLIWICPDYYSIEALFVNRDNFLAAQHTVRLFCHGTTANAARTMATAEKGLGERVADIVKHQGDGDLCVGEPDADRQNGDHQGTAAVEHIDEEVRNRYGLIIFML